MAKKLNRSAELNARELAFVEQYLIDRNGKQAAIRAGYSAKTAEQAASRLLRRPVVANGIRKAMDARVVRAGITQERVLAELEELAFSSIDHYLVDETGRVTLREGAPARAIRAIASIKHKVSTREMGNVSITDREVEIKLWNKPETLKLAGRHVGLFPDRLEVTGKNGRPIQVEAVRAQTDEELIARTKALLEKAAEQVGDACR